MYVCVALNKSKKFPEVKKLNSNTDGLKKNLRKEVN